MAFISTLLKKKEDWTKSAEARYVFHNTFVALSRTSPEVFGSDWKRLGELNPSLPASLWTAAIKVLGCFFNLKAQIKLTAKGILKSDSKDLQVGGKKLTFDVVCKSIKTKAGRFLTDKVARQPFAKKVCVQKQFSRKFRSYIQVTVSGNIYGVKKWEHFVKELCGFTGVLMSFETTLVVISYPDGPESHKGRPFAHKASTLVSTYRYKIFVSAVYIAPGKPTTVKVFVGHDSPAAIFNLLELAKLADEKYCSIKVCAIQASKVVVDSYLNGSTKILDPDH